MGRRVRYSARPQGSPVHARLLACVRGEPGAFPALQADLQCLDELQARGISVPGSEHEQRIR